MQKGDCLYEGKAKKIYSVVGDSSKVLVEFKNSLTAFNGEKKAEMLGKGKLNCLITAHIFTHLNSKGINSHFLELVDETSLLCEKLKIIPIEVVVRNILAGSTAKKFKREEGDPLQKPLVELYYKDDALGDPFINDEQALMLSAVESKDELEILKTLALQINKYLRTLFANVGILLVDFKLEFGRNSMGDIVLGDEVTPDTCRLWDEKTGEKLDKDRFRRDLGDVIEAYEEIYKRLTK